MQIHRFRGTIAIKMRDGPTRYITPYTAHKLSDALKAYANNVNGCDYADSQIGTFNLDNELFAGSASQAVRRGGLTDELLTDNGNKDDD